MLSKAQCTFAPETSFGPGRIPREKEGAGAAVPEAAPVGFPSPSLQRGAVENTGKEFHKAPLQEPASRFRREGSAELLSCQAVMIKLLFPPVLLAFGLLT